MYAAAELLRGEILRERLVRETALRAQSRRDRLRDRRRARGRACRRHRPPRPEARERLPDLRRARQDPGLRARPRREPPGPTAETSAPTTPASTEPGVVMGTAGYISPEQIRGKPGRRAQRPLRLRRRALRDAHGRARLRRGDDRRVPRRDPPRRARRRLHEGSGRVARDRPAGVALPPEESRGAVPVRARPGLRAPGDRVGTGDRDPRPPPPFPSPDAPSRPLLRPAGPRPGGLRRRLAPAAAVRGPRRPVLRPRRPADARARPLIRSGRSLRTASGSRTSPTRGARPTSGSGSWRAARRRT